MRIGVKYARNTSLSQRIGLGSVIPAGSRIRNMAGLSVASRSQRMNKEQCVILPQGIDFTTDHDALLLDMRTAICHLKRAAAQLRS